MLAHALTENAPGNVEPHSAGHTEFDLQQASLMADVLDRLKPQVVINTAAYNAVDRCEQERELSWAVNARGPELLGKLCEQRAIRLVHYGTDYVFDGKQETPYLESHPPNPLNHYAAGKLFGEEAVLKASPKHLVLRTSWIFGPHPAQTKTYVHTVLRAAHSGKELKATTDQVSVPTSAPDLAAWTWLFLERGATGLFHAVNDEPISRFEWTRSILAEALELGLIPRASEVEPVTTSYFNSAMKRPAYSAMDNRKASKFLGHPLGSWRNGLADMLRLIKAGKSA